MTHSDLRYSRANLLFPAEGVIYAPFIKNLPDASSPRSRILVTNRNLSDYFEEVKTDHIDDPVFVELISTIEGANGLIRPKSRRVNAQAPHSKGSLVSKLESQIASFDQRQKHGMMRVLDGLQRIRGLAGSGKTVVLAMKAAQTHLRDPEASILYTFYTRSLYQHIQRMITRFYRQFDDRDPDWDRLRIMHAWGGHSVEGVYFNACISHGMYPMTFTEATQKSRNDPFGYACQQLLSTVKIQPMYDYVFVDEGQDFPNSFLQLVVKLAKNVRVVYAYDELQTIFRVKAPAPSEFLDRGVGLTDDIVLYKCYRNPREIIVCAHALGFGIYGSRVVQMLENREHWEDIGYQITEGDFEEGSTIIIERPAENSLPIVSDAQRPEDIVQCISYDSFKEEIAGVSSSIKKDIEEGLLPEDILVAVVDDRNAKTYLNFLAEVLASYSIRTHNIHADVQGLRDFQQEGCVTLSTVHKAKGNEAFVVYVVGVDALFSSYASVRERNILFTAMTRAKGWVRVSGIGDGAVACKREIDQALQYFPKLKFTYPSQEQLKVMKRDLAEKAIRKQKLERMLDQVLEELTSEEIQQFINQRSIEKGEGQDKREET